MFFEIKAKITFQPSQKLKFVDTIVKKREKKNL